MLKNSYYFMDDEPGQAGGGGDPAPQGQGQQEPAPSGGDQSASWPDNWREMYAGEDETKLSHLSRYASPSAAFDGLIASKQKISSGEYKSTAPFPAEGTDEEKMAWREQNGIPKDPSEYKYSKEFSDEDKAFVDGFNKYAHSQNIPADQADKFMNYLLEIEQAGVEEEQAEVAKFKQENDDKLRAEWGNDYRRNSSVIDGFLNSAPEEVKDSIQKAVMDNGMPLFEDANFKKWLVGKALELNPMPSLVPQGGDPAKGVQDRITEIQQMMNRNDPKYWNDENIQQEYRDLVDMRERLGKAS